MKNTIKMWALIAAFASALVNVQAQSSAAMIPIEQGGKMPIKFDTAAVPMDVRMVYIKEYPEVITYDWYGYPVFSDESDWYGYDRNFYTSNAANSEYYVVEFSKEETPHTVIYTKSGKKIASHKNLTKADVPSMVKKAYYDSKYKNWNVKGDKVEIVNYANNTKVYKIKVEKGKEIHTLFYDEKGKLLKDKMTKM